MKDNGRDIETRGESRGPSPQTVRSAVLAAVAGVVIAVALGLLSFALGMITGHGVWGAIDGVRRLLYVFTALMMLVGSLGVLSPRGVGELGKKLGARVGWHPGEDGLSWYGQTIVASVSMLVVTIVLDVTYALI